MPESRSIVVLEMMPCTLNVPGQLSVALLSSPAGTTMVNSLPEIGADTGGFPIDTRLSGVMTSTIGRLLGTDVPPPETAKFTVPR